MGEAREEFEFWESFGLPQKQSRHSLEGLTRGDRVRVLGSHTHRHGEVGTIEEIVIEGGNPFHYHIRFGPKKGDESWYQRAALRPLDLIEQIAELADAP